jgi:hypothetical protein
VSGSDQQIVDLPIGVQEAAAAQASREKAAKEESSSEIDEESGDHYLKEAIILRWDCMRDNCKDTESYNLTGDVDRQCTEARTSWSRALNHTTDQTRLERLTKKLNDRSGIICEDEIINPHELAKDVNVRRYRPCASKGGSENIDIFGNGERWHVALSSCNAPQ